jgi:hypothetical protein
MSIFGYVVASLFVISGLFLIFFNKIIDQGVAAPETGTMRTVLGFVIALYGLFRALIIYQKRKEASYEDEEN